MNVISERSVCRTSPYFCRCLVSAASSASVSSTSHPFRRLRQRIPGDHAPALTVIIIGIHDTWWLLDIEAIAAA